MELGSINVLAVIVSGIAAMVVGLVWYSRVLFESAWLVEIGRTREEVAADSPSKFLIGFLGALLEAYILAGLINIMGGASLPRAILVAIVLWASFVATTSAANFAFAGRSLRLWLIENGNHLVTVLAMAVILGLWT